MRVEAARPLRRELSHDPAFAVRVKRLGFVSMVALGLIWWLAVATTDVPARVGVALAAGWVLMPVILFASLRLPPLRYALVLPASLVGVGLLILVGGWLPASGLAATGWLLVTAGIMLGGLLGAWFWFRLLPVPVALDEPFSPGRRALIAMHVALIVVGLILAATPLV